MPAMTSAVVAVAGLGLSIQQTIHQGNLKRKAEAAGAAASARLRGITEVNKLAALQVPTEGIELAKEQQARREATLVPAIQQDARTALGGATSIAQTGTEADIKLAAQTADAMYKRDVAVLGEDAAIEKRRAERLAKLEEAELAGAGLAARDAAEAQVAAAGSAATAAGILGEEIPKLDKETAWKKTPSGGGTGNLTYKGVTADSDINLKENIDLVGKSPSGLNIYEFKYKGEKGRYRGVMAQEVPWASSNGDNGYLQVDYSQIDVDFIKLTD